VGKPEGNRPLVIPKCWWEDNIKLDLGGIGCGCMDWIYLTQDRDQWRALMNTNEPSSSIKCWKVLEKTVGFSRRALLYGVG
jgi:hypothetical protein